MFFFAAPIIWVIISSVQPERALTVLPPALTADLWLDGYKTIYGDPNWFHSLWVSLQVAIITTVMVIVLSAPAAYALARFDLPGQADHPGHPGLHPDGARDRDGHPGAPHVPVLRHHRHRVRAGAW